MRCRSVERPTCRVVWRRRNGLTQNTGGTVPTYVVGMNVLVFLVAFWTAVIYGLMTREWFGTALWLTVGFAALTAPRLIPPREDE